MGNRATSTAVPSLAVERLAELEERVVIDLRSPSEFAEDHLPGARNVPLFDDAERALIGTLYQHRSPEAAFEQGRTMVRAKVGDLVASLARAAGWSVPDVDLQSRVDHITAQGLARLEGGVVERPLEALDGRPVVLHCWRGGLRSRSVVHLLHSLGLGDAVVLSGGYKSWRAYVRRELATWTAPPCFVLRGLTGVGKTLVLRELERRRPGWTVDLEGLAGHRSSILGMVGLQPCSQKAFESRLVQRLREVGPGPIVFEGESRKVGDAILPPQVWEALAGGTNLLLETSVERRCEVLIEDYLATEANRDPLRQQLPFIEQRLGAKKWAGRLVELLDRDEAELVRTLLEHYYDPLYRHSEKGRDYAVRIDVQDPSRAAAEIETWIGERVPALS